MKALFLSLLLSLAIGSVSAQNCQEALTPIILQEGNNLTTKTEFDTYQWVKDGQPITGATARTFTPTEAGDYQVKVTKRSKLFAFTPTGIGDMTVKMPFEMFPNPTSGSLTIVSDQFPTGKISVELMNFNGQRVLTQDVMGSQNTFNVDVSGLPKGVYGVRISGGEKFATRTLIIE